MIEISNRTHFQFCGILASEGITNLEDLQKKQNDLPTFEEFNWIVMPGCTDQGETNNEIEYSPYLDDDDLVYDDYKNTAEEFLKINTYYENNK